MCDGEGSSNVNLVNRDTEQFTLSKVMLITIGVPQDGDAFRNSQALAICGDLRRTFRPKHPDGIEPWLEILPKPPRPCIFNGTDLCARPNGPNSGIVSSPFAMKQRYESHMNRSRTAGAPASTLTASRSAGIGCAVISL